VLGTGLDRCYPTEQHPSKRDPPIPRPHERLKPGTQPGRRGTFATRNRSRRRWPTSSSPAASFQPGSIRPRRAGRGTDMMRPIRSATVRVQREEAPPGERCARSGKRRKGSARPVRREMRSSQRGERSHPASPQSSVRARRSRRQGRCADRERIRTRAPTRRRRACPRGPIPGIHSESNTSRRARPAPRGLIPKEQGTPA